MKFDLLRLKNKIDPYIEIDTTCEVGKELLEKTELLELKELKVKGEIALDTLDDFTLDLDVTGVMVLPCAVTLKPVDYPFSIKIEGNINQMLKEFDENAKKIENSIDILPIIWENVLMEIPMRVTSEDAKHLELEGDGWKLITEEEALTEVNPALAKLKDLL